MVDLRDNSSADLSLHCLNTDAVYRALAKCDNESQIRTYIDRRYKYTKAQWRELIADWAGGCFNIGVTR